MTVVAVLIALAAALYAALLATLWWAQERLLFHPTVLSADHRFNLPPDVQEQWVEVPGARLHALHLRLPHPDGVVFFLHGNAGSLDTWFVNAEFYRRANLDLVMIDFRGYGKSTGRIDSEAQLNADVQAAWERFSPAYAGLRKVVYGRSLGSGLATTLASRVQPDLTVLVSPYVNMADLAHEQYPWVPAWVLRSLLRYPLQTDTRLAGIRGPVLLVHGGRDALIAPSHTQRLQAVAPSARVLVIPEAGHGDIHEYPAYLDGLAQALKAR